MLDRTRAYTQSFPQGYGKPNGFWVSVAGEEDWPTWCRDEDFEISRLAVEYAVTLADGANVLRIENHYDIDEFYEQYAVETERERRYGIGPGKSWPIDWRAVTEHYDGIIIAPYQLARRYSMGWYYGWDCASG